MARVVERQFKKDGIDLQLGTKVEGVSEQKTGRQGQGRRQGAEGRLPGDRRRPHARHRAAQPRRRRGQDRGERPDQGRRVPADLGRGHLRDRRPGPRARRSPTRPPRRASSRSRPPPAPKPTRSTSTSIPGATFCHPQVASVGMTEAAGEGGRQARSRSASSSSAAPAPRSSTTTAPAWCKIVGDPEYGEILGAHIVGNIACDMISELVNTMALEGGYQELGRIIHPHPTMSEAVLDAARAVDGWATTRRPVRGASAPPSTTTSARPTPTWRRSGSAALFAEAGVEQPEWQPISFGHVLKASGRQAVVVRGGQERATSPRSSAAPTSAACPRSSTRRAGRSRTTASIPIRAAIYAKESGRVVSFSPRRLPPGLRRRAGT